MPSPVARLLHRLPAWLALLALCVRFALPALHQHGPSIARHPGASPAVSTSPSEPRHAGGSLRPAEAEAHGDCAVCAFELATPGGALPVPVALPQLLRGSDRPELPPAAPRAPPDLRDHHARASPASASPSTGAGCAPVS